MAKSATKDMTVGSPMKLILSFSMPLLIGFIFQQFYSVVDTFIVGRTLGMNALAGVGATGSINFLIVGFVMGVCGGCVIPIAQRFGAKDYSDMRRYVANCVWLGIVLSVVITVVVCILCRDILMWMKTPEDIFEYSYQYIFIVFLGIPATYLYNILSGIMRSMGNSKIPLVFLIISSAINIALDLICIINLHMGVSGAAVATVASQLISGILCLIYMMKKFDILKMHREETRISTYHLYHLCMMGIPMGLQYSITAIGSVVIQTAINSLGSIAVASVTAGQKIGMFFCCPYDALGSTMATYGGQNVGAKKLDRLSGGLKAAGNLGNGEFENPTGNSGNRIFDSGVCGAVALRQSACHVFRGECTGGGHCKCKAVSGMQQCLLHSVGFREYCTLFDSGYGIQQVCNSGRRL